MSKKPELLPTQARQSVWKCSPADGTIAAHDMKRISAFPLAAQITYYLSFELFEKRTYVGNWPIVLKKSVCTVDQIFSAS